MKKTYISNVIVRDYRFSSPKKIGNVDETTVLFPPKYFGKDEIISLLNDHRSETIIISGIHESEYKKYKTTLENLDLSVLNKPLSCVIVITNTLFPYVFSKQIRNSKSQFTYSDANTKQYILDEAHDQISSSYINFRLWKKVYDSEQLWSCLSERNHMGYINSPVNWDNRILRGYLDFSQIYLIQECRNLCIEQLIGFQLYYDHLYFYSLDRLTDEICEQANHMMDNSRDGTPIYIGSVFVSGTSERKLNSRARNEENVFYFFKHADCDANQNVRAIFEWATQTLRIDQWFPPERYEGKIYARVGESSFVAVNGNNYWASRHYINWKEAFWLKQDETYQLIQKQFGAHPAILKMGHFDAIDHHDLFGIKVDSLVETDIITSQIVQDSNNSSYDFLLAEFLQALVNSPGENELNEYLRQDIPRNKLEVIKKKYILHRDSFDSSPGGIGLIVYLNDYHTSKIIESIKTIFVEELQQRIVPIVPIEKNMLHQPYLFLRCC